MGILGVPHYTTLHKANRRLAARCRLPARLLGALPSAVTWDAAVGSVALPPFDSTGLDCGQRGAYCVRRRSSASKRWQRLTYRRCRRLELAVDTTNHVILAAFAGYSPRPDTDRLPCPLLKATRQQVKVKSPRVADAGYDSEPNHKLCA